MPKKSIIDWTNARAFLLFTLAAAVGIITMYHHEMWRDESQAFLIVRDSKNLSELWQNVRYEGHPILWYLILYIFYYIFPSIYTIQVIHLIIGLAVAVLIIWYSPFRFFEKVLLVFSYFFSYEYLILSRNYAIGIFFLFATIVVFHRKKSNAQIVIAGALLGLSANANIYSLFISFWLFLYFLLQHCFTTGKMVYQSKPALISTMIFVLLNLIAVLQIISPVDRTPKIRVAYRITIKKLDKVFGEIGQAMYYLANPSQKEKYWGSDLFKEETLVNDAISNSLLQHLPMVLAVVIIVLFCLSSMNKRSPVLFFLPSFITLFLFTYMVFDKGFLRHTGAFFILFISAYWIYRELKTGNRKVNSVVQKLFTLMLFLQVISAVIVHVGDIKYQFSNAKAAADFLQVTKRDTAKILVHPDFYGMSLLHYSGTRKVYYPIGERWGSFIRFDTTRKSTKYIDIFRIARSEGVNTFVFNSRLDDNMLKFFGINLIYLPAKPSTAEGEDFYIYERRKN